jgi:hypothetical protein
VPFTSRGRAVPDPGAHAVAAHPGAVRDPPFAPASHVEQVTGLASLPNYVAGLATVPDLGARPFTTSPSLPGAYATILWSRPVVAAQPQDSRPAPYWTCSHAGAGGKTSISQPSHTIGSFLPVRLTDRTRFPPKPCSQL